MLVNVNQGDDFCRFEVVDVLSDSLYAFWGFQHHDLPPGKVNERSDGHHVCFVHEDVLVKTLRHPLEVVDRHRLQSMEYRTPK